MNYDAFVQKWNGRQVTAYSGECVALVAQYLAENGKAPYIAYANAKDWWGNSNVGAGFDFITNNPNDYNQVPNRGDVIVWNGGLAGSGGYGHIAIYDGKVSPGIFRSFDQNWGGRQAHFVTHNYNNVIGWFRPKVSAPVPSGGGQIMDTRDKVIRQYETLRGLRRGITEGEIAAWLNKPYDSFNITARPEIESIDKQEADVKAQLANLQTAINQQNQVITELTQSGNATKAQYQEAVAKLAELNAQLTEAHDTIKDLQQNATVPVDEQTVVQNVLVRFWKSLFKKS